MSKHSGTSLFLIELVIMLCVFVTAAAIDTLMLVRANNLAAASADLDRAVECAVSAAECYKQTGGGAAIGMTRSGEKWTLLYDEDWEPVKSGGTYELKMAAGDLSADIAVVKGAQEIYSLSVKAAQYEK